MFQYFENESWTPSAGSVTVTDNTDFEIDGSSKKIVWNNALGESVTISFDSINLGLWEEITFYLSQRMLNLPGDLYSITVNGQSFSFEKIRTQGWHHMLIDCSEMGSVTEIVITSLTDNLTLFIDALGVRKVTFNSDIDLLKAFKDKISLDYGVSTTLAADLDIGAASVSLTSTAYINNTSLIEVDDGAGTTEQLQLANRSGILKSPPTNAFTAGDTVRVLCPTLMGDHDDTQPDPICGVTFFDMEVGESNSYEDFVNGNALKIYTGKLGVLVFVDCSSQKKLLQLSREYNYKYGERFKILLDGELVFILLETSLFVEDVIGNNPRMAYYYRVEPQPYTMSKAVEISTINFTLESEPVETIMD